MKVFKRNAVIITVVLFVCVAAYLNYSYSKKGDEIDALADANAQVSDVAEGDVDANVEGDDAQTSDAGLYFTDGAQPAGTTNVSEYFATARLNREKARDSAAETLATVSTTEGASTEIIDEALAKIAAIASNSEKEAELEALIMAKGFSDCVVFISEDGIKVTVPSPVEGLTNESVAQINDIITSETTYSTLDLKIIPVK